MAFQYIKHLALNSNARHVLSQLVARAGVKDFAEVNKVCIQSAMLADWPSLLCMTQ